MEIEEVQKLPPKVVKMFDAVIEMLSENVDINNMKVADITNRAGIGKGTAYEYFSTKEELITKALIYDTQKQFFHVSEVIRKSPTFKQKVMAGLDWIAENFMDCKTFTQLARIGFGTFDVSKTLKDEFIRIRSCDDCVLALAVVDEIMECGIKEGVIQRRDKNLMRMALSSQVLMFAMFLTDKEYLRDTMLGSGDVKQFAYESIVKALN